MSTVAIEPVSGSAPQRCITGIAGLDDILMGGLPRHHLYLVRGRAGTGKATLGVQFLLAGALRKAISVVKKRSGRREADR